MAKQQQKIIERIVEMMKSGGIYEDRYLIQIEQTADNMCEIEELKAIIRRDGRTISEIKTGGLGSKVIAHPLYVTLQNAQGLLVRQLAALGLNKMSEKKQETKKEVKAKTAFESLLDNMNG